MDDSPIARLLDALAAQDPDAVVALVAPDGRLLTVDGRRAQGTDAILALLTDFMSAIRSCSHRITDQWHIDDVWIAETLGSYELKDWLQIKDRPRAFVVRDGPEGITDVRVYGAHEQSFADRPDPEAGTWVGERWVPPL